MIISGNNVWLNSLIRCNNKVMFNYRMFNSEIKYVSDLIYDDKWITYNKLLEKHECNINFLEVQELLTVITNLPNHWKYHLVIEADAE